MEADLIDQGIELMLYGMGTVVVFLSLLVVATTFMSSMLNRVFPELPATAPAKPDVAGQVPDGALVAVMTAAIQKHRSGQ